MRVGIDSAMSFDVDYLQDHLEAVAGRIGNPRRLVVGFSGGMDSAVLLHALASGAGQAEILALHVDHGLHPDSARWAAKAQAFAADLDVAFESVRVFVDEDSGQGLEAAAREARYAVFDERVQPGDWLLSAHHLNDQGETLLLNLVRGSGPLGLAGMPAVRPLGAGYLVRPLLHVSRDDLAAYAALHGLGWVEDPGNEDTRFDRNFLRGEVMPLLARRWPDITARLGRSAGRSAATQALLDELAALDLECIVTSAAHRLSISALAGLDMERQRNVLRFACRNLSLPTPPAARLDAVIRDLLPADSDTQPLVEWPGVELRRYRDELFILSAPFPGSLGCGAVLRPGRRLILGPGLGSLTLEPVSGSAIRPETAEKGLTVQPRVGGERLKVAAGGRSQSLKNLLQAEGVLPWMRDRLPLLKLDDDVVAVANLWINSKYAGDRGYRVVWHDQPDFV